MSDSKPQFKCKQCQRLAQLAEDLYLSLQEANRDSQQLLDTLQLMKAELAKRADEKEPETCH